MLYFLRTTALNLPQLTRAAGIVLILVVGLIHMYKAPMHFEAASYIGAAFVANFVASLVAALGIWLGAPNWGWLPEILGRAIRTNPLPERQKALWVRAFAVTRLASEQILDPEDAANFVVRAVGVGSHLPGDGARGGDGPGGAGRPLEGPPGRRASPDDSEDRTGAFRIVKPARSHRRTPRSHEPLQDRCEPRTSDDRARS
jgi:hypothetical protein